MNNKNYISYLQQRNWSDKTIPQGIEIIANEFNIDLEAGCWKIEETSVYEDTQLCGDLKLYNNSKNYMIGYRCRKEQMMLDYPLDVTLRYRNKQGHKTEYAKIMEGKGDLNLYTFEVNGNVVRWVLMNIHALRKAHKFNTENGKWEPKKSINYSILSNKDKDDTDFIVYHMMSIIEYDKHFAPEDKVIIAHSLGYFDDIFVKEYGLYGAKFKSYELKNKEDRIDGN